MESWPAGTTNGTCTVEFSTGLEPLGPARCRYTDGNDIDSGPVTSVVGAFVELFHRCRLARRSLESFSTWGGRAT